MIGYTVVTLSQWGGDAFWYQPMVVKDEGQASADRAATFVDLKSIRLQLEHKDGPLVRPMRTLSSAASKKGQPQYGEWPLGEQVHQKLHLR